MYLDGRLKWVYAVEEERLHQLEGGGEYAVRYRMCRYSGKLLPPDKIKGQLGVFMGMREASRLRTMENWQRIPSEQLRVRKYHYSDARFHVGLPSLAVQLAFEFSTKPV